MDGPSRCEKWRLCLPVFAGPILYLFFSLKKKVLVFDSRSPTNKNNKHNRQR